MFRGGAGGFGPPFQRFFEKGDLKYVLLELLQDKPSHGYELIRALQERFHGFYSPSPGAVYPTIAQLADEGLVAVHADAGRNVVTLTDAGRRLVEAQLADWVREQLAAGIHPVDVPDVFYLLKRMGTWAGPTHGAVEFVRDTASPLWSWRMLRFELGLAAGERAREHFHLRMLRELAPELVAIPFADGFSWTRRRSRAARMRSLAMKALLELRRRAGPAAGERHGAPDPFARVQRLVREAASARRDHPAWDLLDRGRVDSLLTRPPAALDTMSRYYVWRLATVLLAEELS
jgi:DNA-binding PadR family transcriptional regulator